MLPAEAPGARRADFIAARALALAAACAVVVAGCGADDDVRPDGGSPAASVTDAEFTLDVDGPGGEKPRTSSLVCGGSSGTGSPACALLDGQNPEIPPDPAAPTPPETACTEIFGGPDLLTIEGTLRGEPIEAELTRANGCEIERYDRFAPILSELFPGYEPGAALRPPDTG